MARSKNDIVTSVAAALHSFGVGTADTILVGVSGGIDSIVLASILSKLKRSGTFKSLAIAHLNHNLRGKSSDSDAQFVKKFAKKIGAEYYEGSADVRSVALKEKIGIEEAARMLRYDYFIACAEENNIKWVATAHNANDQLETILMNIVRGSGIRGMKGIPKARDLARRVTLIRPLLDNSREQILNYAKKEKLKWREDHTNSSDDYTRNRIRKSVVPALRDSYPDKNIYSGVITLTKNMEGVAAYIDAEVEKLRKKAVIRSKELFIRPTHVEIATAALRSASPIISRELIASEIERLLGRYFSFDSSSWQRVNQLFEKPEGKLQLSKEIIISRSGKAIRLEVIPPLERIREFLIVSEPVDSIVGIIELAESKKAIVSRDNNIAYISQSYVHTHGLLVRNWMAADRIRPFGMKGSRAVSDLLSEAGIKTEHNKQNFPIVVAADSPETVLWIPGIRASELCRVREGETACKLKRISK
jgi:tRNA(Ile)-lysidine synthase